MIDRWRLIFGAVGNIVLAFVMGGLYGNDSPYVVSNYTIAVILFWIGFSVKKIKP